MIEQGSRILVRRGRQWLPGWVVWVSEDRTWVNYVITGVEDLYGCAIDSQDVQEDTDGQDRS